MNLIMLICLWGVNTFFYNKHVLNFIFSAYYMLSSNIKASQTFTSPSSRLSGCLMDLCVIELICFALWPLYPFIFRSSFPLSHFTSIKIFQDSQNVSFSNDESDFLVWRRFPKKIRRWGAETKLFSYWDSNLYIYNNKKKLRSYNYLQWRTCAPHLSYRKPHFSVCTNTRLLFHADESAPSFTKFAEGRSQLKAFMTNRWRHKLQSLQLQCSNWFTCYENESTSKNCGALSIVLINICTYIKHICIHIN